MREAGSLALAAQAHAVAAGALQRRGEKKKAPNSAAASSLDIPQCWHEPRRIGAPLLLSFPNVRRPIGWATTTCLFLPRPPGRPVAKARTGTLSGLAGMRSRDFANYFRRLHQRNNPPPCEQIPGWSGASTGAIVEVRPGLLTLDQGRRQSRPAQQFRWTMTLWLVRYCETCCSLLLGGPPSVAELRASIVPRNCKAPWISERVL